MPELSVKWKSPEGQWLDHDLDLDLAMPLSHILNHFVPRSGEICGCEVVVKQEGVYLVNSERLYDLYSGKGEIVHFLDDLWDAKKTSEVLEDTGFLPHHRDVAAVGAHIWTKPKQKAKGRRR